MRIVWLSLLVISGCAAPSYVAGSSKVLAGPNGVRLTLVEVKGQERSGTLIRVDGSESQIDGKPLLYHREEQHYVTQLDGKPAAVVQITKEPSGALQWFVSLPDVRDRMPLTVEREGADPRDVETMLQQHDELMASGAIAALQAFNRDRRAAQQQALLAREVERTEKLCGPITLQVDWASWPDDQLDSAQLTSWCAAPLSGLAQLCRYELAREEIRAHAHQVVCRHGEMGAQLNGGVLTWSTHGKAMNKEEMINRYLREEARWGGERRLSDLIALEKTRLCTNGAGQYVGLTQSPYEPWRLFYGDGNTFRRVPPPPRPLRSDWFFAPHETAPDNNPNHQGIDLRYYSRLSQQGDACALRCGARTIELSMVETGEARALLAKTPVDDPLPRRRPYALARDRQGTYYFVDISDAPEARDFRLFRGAKGNLGELKMINIVSDSHGDVFSTASGELRLVLEKEQSYWVEKSVTQELINIPVERNLGVIYQELGIYTGVLLGTPCEVF